MQEPARPSHGLPCYASVEQSGTGFGRLSRWSAHAGGITLLALAAAAWGSGSVQAQQVVANGISQQVSGPFSLDADGSPVFYALNGGLIETIGSVQVLSEGDFAAAVMANLNSSVVITLGTSISTTGEGSAAVSAQNNSTIEITGTTISTSGADSKGVISEFDSSVTLTNSSVTTDADDAISIDTATVILDNTSVEAFGFGAVLSGSSQLTLKNGASIVTTEAAADAVSVIGEASTVTINDSELHAQGAGASALALSESATVTVTGSTLEADDGAIFKVTGGTTSANLSNSTLTAPELSSVTAGGTLNLYVNASTVTGIATTAPGGTTQVNLLGSSVWNVTGDSKLTLLVNQAGSVVQFAPPASDSSPFKRLTTSDYVGVGGTIVLNTRLGGDDSPSDRLIIDGGFGLGSSYIAITNAGGVGALTQVNGILVVDAVNGGTTVPGLFTLAAPVIVGPYEYSLYRGSVDTSNPNAWYLRSVLDCSLDPTAPVCSPDMPDYRQETSLYAALPAMTLLYGRLMLDTLHERRGTSAGSYADGAPSAAWARVVGQHGDRDGGKGGVYGSGPQYDYNFWAFQGGADLYRDGDAGTSRNHAGAFFAIGQASGDVRHIGSGTAGENSFTAYSWGAYWTHYMPNNAYIDTLLMGTWYDIDAKSNRIPKMTTDGGAFGASVEGGYPLYAGRDGFSIEPQAQLAFQTINLDNSSDVSARVRFDNINSLVGRLGVRFAQDFAAPTWLSGAPSKLTAWVRPNFWYEFLGDPKTRFSSDTGFVPFSADLGGTTFEINTGFSTDVADGVAIYANGSYLVGISGDAGGNAYDGKLGIKFAW